MARAPRKRAGHRGGPSRRRSCCRPWCCSARSSSIRSCTRSTARSSTSPAPDSSGLDNYRRMFTDDTTRTAIKNNVDLGRVRADGRHRARADLRGADRADPVGDGVQAVVFMPMAISFLAAGVIFRLVYEQDPGARRRQRRGGGWSTTPSRSPRRLSRGRGRCPSTADAAEAAAPSSRATVRGPATPARLPLVGVAPGRRAGRRREPAKRGRSVR